MKKVLPALLSAALLLSFAACGASGEAASAKTTPASGDVVSADLPDGWTLVSGTDMNGAGGSDYICRSKEFQIGDPYLQAARDDRDAAGMQALLEGEDPFGTYYGSFELANGIWYIAENAAGAVLGEKTLLVKGYECDFQSDEVRTILGSIQWAA